MGYKEQEIKERNGAVSVEVEGLKVGDVFLFEEESDDAQGHVVTDIYRYPHSKVPNPMVEYIPEWTPVRNSSIFQYGKKKIQLKKKHN